MISKSDEKKKKSIYNSLIISLSSDDEGQNENDQGTSRQDSAVEEINSVAGSDEVFTDSLLEIAK